MRHEGGMRVAPFGEERWLATTVDVRDSASGVTRQKRSEEISISNMAKARRG